MPVSTPLPHSSPASLPYLVGVADPDAGELEALVLDQVAEGGATDVAGADVRDADGAWHGRILTAHWTRVQLR